MNLDRALDIIALAAEQDLADILGRAGLEVTRPTVIVTSDQIAEAARVAFRQLRLDQLSGEKKFESHADLARFAADVRRKLFKLWLTAFFGPVAQEYLGSLAGKDEVVDVSDEPATSEADRHGRGSVDRA